MTATAVREDSETARFTAPFPWFGSKRRIAADVWSRFGAVRNYVEPFFGSGAVLLGRPGWEAGVSWIETVNDLDGMVANFWRAVRAAPDLVAEWADWPTNENDLHARHAWLVGRKPSLQARLEGDPEYYDAQIAGWWVWGMACWIGGGFCSGSGPWHVVDGELVRTAADGHGVERKLVHLGDAGQGVNRQLVHLGRCQGVQRKQVHLGNGAAPGRGECGLRAWMEALAQRLARVRVACGDWSRVTGDTPTVKQPGPCGVFLDPPYARSERAECYSTESDCAPAVREWALERGDDPRYRIALCGYEGEHTMPNSWECVAWKANGGYGGQAANGRGRVNAGRERIWFSPHCLRAGGAADGGLFSE